MARQQHNKKFEDQGWKLMQETLEKEMPVEKNKKRFAFIFLCLLFIGISASIYLASTYGYFSTKDSNASNAKYTHFIKPFDAFCTDKNDSVNTKNQNKRNQKTDNNSKLSDSKKEKTLSTIANRKAKTTKEKSRNERYSVYNDLGVSQKYIGLDKLKLSDKTQNTIGESNQGSIQPFKNQPAIAGLLKPTKTLEATGSPLVEPNSTNTQPIMGRKKVELLSSLPIFINYDWEKPQNAKETALIVNALKPQFYAELKSGMSNNFKNHFNSLGFGSRLFFNTRLFMDIKLSTGLSSQFNEIILEPLNPFTGVGNQEPPGVNDPEPPQKALRKLEKRHIGANVNIGYYFYKDINFILGVGQTYNYSSNSDTELEVNPFNNALNASINKSFKHFELGLVYRRPLNTPYTVTTYDSKLPNFLANLKYIF